MKTCSRFFHCFFLVIFCIVYAEAQNCNDLKRRDAAQKYYFGHCLGNIKSVDQPINFEVFISLDTRSTQYYIPTPRGSTTASALLAENNLSRLETFSNCTIYFESGVDFEIDVPLALFRVTVIAGEGSGIKIDRKQTLVITYCKLIPQGDSYWSGIELEDETAKLIMNNSEVSYALNRILQARVVK